MQVKRQNINCVAIVFLLYFLLKTPQVLRVLSNDKCHHWGNEVKFYMMLKRNYFLPFLCLNER